jgi:N-acetylglucosamine-6-sulfatase
MGYHAVRDEHWKYIHYDDQADADELYDLTIDPYELKNIVHDSAASDALLRMRKELQKQLIATSGKK